MLVFVIIIVALAVIGLILYLGEFRFEFKMEKNATDSSEINKSALDCLSHTELNILKQLADGKTNQEIADGLFISVHTVKKHISNIFKKLNIQSRNETRKFKELISNNI
jgi:DNA-binding CsgD family transcriptional regulator